MDEYVINPKLQEKYLSGEAEKFKEAYTTWRREADGVLKFYILANPYSLFNPLFVEWNVDINSLHIGSFYVGDTFIIHYASSNPLLKAKLLEANPLYKFDKDYTDYALEGKAVNDRNIRIAPFPKNYRLKFVFRITGKNIGVFENNEWDINDRFYCKVVDEVSVSRTIYCFDFSDLIENSIVMSLDERIKIQKFKDSFRKRAVVFEDIHVYYFIEEIYKNI